MPTDRDLFANFERMRREMDELFGDVFGGGGGRGLHSRAAFTPAVDVYYVADPPRAIVRAGLASRSDVADALARIRAELVRHPRLDAPSFEARVRAFVGEEPS